MKAELNLARWKHVRSNLSGSCGANPCIGNSVVLNVENVEEFFPERSAIPFANREILENREVRVIDGENSAIYRVLVGPPGFEPGTNRL